MILKTYLYDFWGLFFPKICASCNNTLLHNESFICTYCRLQLPKTNYHLDPENEVAQTFWGRCKIENAAAYLFFSKKGIVQALLHKLKYKGDKEIGLFLGKMYGYELLNTPFSTVDIIIPVPLHYKKLKKLGYNQSELIAEGLKVVLNKPLDRNALIRKWANPTQTKRNRYERWLNVNEVFEVKFPNRIMGKHILLVDDVITTGATLEACVNVLLSCPNTKVSILTLAKA